MKKSVNLYVDLGTKQEEGVDTLTTKEKLLLMIMVLLVKRQQHQNSY